MSSGGEIRVRSGESVLGAAAAAALAAALGLAVGLDRIEVALFVVAAIGGIALLGRLTPGGWCVLLLVSTVAVRAPVIWLGLPSAVDFLHYGIAVAFGVAALTQPVAGPAGRTAGRWLIGFFAVVGASMAANLSHPVRGLLFVLIAGEPLLILWAAARWGMTRADRTKIAVAAGGLWLLQLPIAAYQGATLGLSDFIEGTLLGQGASQHILGGLFALGLFVLVAGMLAQRVPFFWGTLGSTISLGMVIATQAIQVALAMTVALVALVAASVATAEVSRRRSRSVRTAAAVVALGLAVAAPLAAKAFLPGILSRAVRLASVDQLPETRLIADRFASDPRTAVIGTGPGTSGSRAAILLTPQQMKTGSPLAALNLPPTEQALEVVRSTRAPMGGSAESYASSTYGILGDLGIVGFVGLAILFVLIWRAARKAGTWLAPAVAAALVMTFILNFVDNWIEYPEYGVPLAVLLAVAIAPPRDEPSTRSEAPPTELGHVRGRASTIALPGPRAIPETRS